MAARGSNPEEPRHAIRLNIKNEKEQKTFMREIFPEFLRVVNPRESGLLDALYGNEVITESDNSSLSGKDVCTRKDQARKLFILLDKVPFDVFMAKVAPELCLNFAYIIPDKFTTLEDAETSVIPPAQCSCLRHEIQHRIRPAKIADILYHKECIDIESYSAIIEGARRKEDVWTVIFEAFMDITQRNQLQLEESIKSTLQKHYVNVPNDFREQMTKGLPCLCADSKMQPPEQGLTLTDKVGKWLHEDKLSSHELLGQIPSRVNAGVNPFRPVQYRRSGSLESLDEDMAKLWVILDTEEIYYTPKKKVTRSRSSSLSSLNVDSFSNGTLQNGSCSVGGSLCSSPTTDILFY